MRLLQMPQPLVRYRKTPAQILPTKSPAITRLLLPALRAALNPAAPSPSTILRAVHLLQLAPLLLHRMVPTRLPRAFFLMVIIRFPSPQPIPLATSLHQLRLVFGLSMPLLLLRQPLVRYRKTQAQVLSIKSLPITRLPLLALLAVLNLEPLSPSTILRAVHLLLLALLLLHRMVPTRLPLPLLAMVITL